MNILNKGTSRNISFFLQICVPFFPGMEKNICIWRYFREYKTGRKNPRWGTPAWSKERAKLAWYAKTCGAQQGSLGSFAGFGLLCSCARHRSVFWQMRMWVEVMSHFSFRTYMSECAPYSLPLLQQIQKSCSDRKHDKTEEIWIIKLPKGKGYTPKLGWITFIMLSYWDLGVCCDS